MLVEKKKIINKMLNVMLPSLMTLVLSLLCIYFGLGYAISVFIIIMPLLAVETYCYIENRSKDKKNYLNKTANNKTVNDRNMNKEFNKNISYEENKIEVVKNKDKVKKKVLKKN